MPGGFVCSASLKAKWDGTAVKQVLAGDRAVRKLFTKEQRAFYVAHAPEGLALDDLVPLGPINILKLAYVPKGFARRLVAELWFYPDGSRILELSDKTRPAAAFQLAAETRAFLGRARRGPLRRAADQDADGTRAFLEGGAGSGLIADPLRQDAVSKAAVADRQRRLAELLHDGPDDAGAGEDDLRALGLEAHDRAAARPRRASGRARSGGRSPTARAPCPGRPRGRTRPSRA